MKAPAFKLPHLSTTERYLAIGAAMACSCVLLYYVGFGPWWRHMQHVRHEIAGLERQIDSHRRLLSRKEIVSAQIAAYEGRLRLAGPKETEVAALLREVESLGGQSGVTLGEVKPLVTEDSGPYQARAFEVQCEGTLPEIVRFIYGLQTSASLFAVDQAAVDVKEADSARLKATMRLTSLAIEAPERELGTTPPADESAKSDEREKP